MQRRAVPSSSSRPTSGGGPAYSTSSSSTHSNTPPPSSPSLGLHRAKRKNSSSVAWMIVVMILLLTIILAIIFPAQFQKAEHEAEVLANKALKVEQDLAQKALRKEQEMFDQWTAHESGGKDSNQKQPNNAVPDDWSERIQASRAASKRMEQQSSRWVDGEKKLKQKLQVLYDRQNNQQGGKDLGVPVLTRYLGDDFPAYVVDGIDGVDEWKKNVEAEYAKMRKEEEAWQKKMQKLISQRERDIGITTA